MYFFWQDAELGLKTYTERATKIILSQKQSFLLINLKCFAMIHSNHFCLI